MVCIYSPYHYIGDSKKKLFIYPKIDEFLFIFGAIANNIYDARNKLKENVPFHHFINVKNMTWPGDWKWRTIASCLTDLLNENIWPPNSEPKQFTHTQTHPIDDGHRRTPTDIGQTRSKHNFTYIFRAKKKSVWILMEFYRRSHVFYLLLLLQLSTGYINL